MLYIPKYKSDSENKNVVFVVIIVFILGMVLGRLFTSGVTGSAVLLELVPYKAESKQYDNNPITLVSVSPKNIIAGNKITISVNPGTSGANAVFKIYKINDQGYGVLKAKLRRPTFLVKTRQNPGFKIRDTITFDYFTSAGWSPGLYEVRVLDYNTKKEIADQFNIYYTFTRSQDIRKSGLEYLQGIYG